MMRPTMTGLTESLFFRPLLIGLGLLAIGCPPPPSLPDGPPPEYEPPRTYDLDGPKPAEPTPPEPTEEPVEPAPPEPTVAPTPVTTSSAAAAPSASAVPSAVPSAAPEGATP